MSRGSEPLEILRNFKVVLKSLNIVFLNFVKGCILSGTRGQKTRKFVKLRSIIKLTLWKAKVFFGLTSQKFSAFCEVRLTVFNKSLTFSWDASSENFVLSELAFQGKMWDLSLKTVNLFTQNGVESTLAKPERPSKYFCKSEHL